MKNIMEYLGIEEEFYNDINNKEIMQKIIKEVKTVNNKYKNKYKYILHDDINRCYNKNTEVINVVEKLDYITIFEIKPIKNSNII